MKEELTPRQIVDALDKFIIGQKDAKKSVAIALRNRYRRKQLPPEVRDEIMPKNIIMIGPTGVGKTEIARRMAKMVNAPFVKIEATKFTEVGYVGRDVETMVRDLLETAIRIVKSEKMEKVVDKAAKLAEDRLLRLLVPMPIKNKKQTNPFNMFFSGDQGDKEEKDVDSSHNERVQRAKDKRKELSEDLQSKKLENEIIEIEVPERSTPMVEIFSGQGIEEMGVNFQDLLGNFMPEKKKKRKVTVAQARKILQQEEAQKLIDMDEVTSEAIERAEHSGIIFLDEIDKIAGKDAKGGGPDVSREGVQRDILPIVEGSTIMTKYGPVKTDYVLFIAAGAFHVAKPSDLIPELQGRFPIRVELQSLTEEDLKKILTEPENAIIKQYKALLETEGVDITFTEDAIEEIARTAKYLNQEMENIGARRLHTILEKVLLDLSFEASDIEDQEIIIDKVYIEHKLKDLVKNRDLSRYIL